MKLKATILAVAIAATPFAAFAQTQPAPETPAVATPDKVNPDAPVKGKNSFTEAQAKERIEAAGYTEVGALTLDDNGIWNAPAKKDGAAVTVQLDYQGNIVAK
ncbi:PepSY domain-containing protein [Escherichia coli]|nr:PepSY domain-containing protein [Salmonella enterica subsp. enterica serovar Enteritidis]EFG2886116.1 PepSY domain-containing protein [Escherichia coli]